ncbi:MAG: hypothetical protein H3Z53_00165 [archaeon]|nr:hypothetical protein [archaeon]
MDPSTIGLIGGMIGSAIGVLGGVIGTYFSIKNMKTPAERRFMVKYASGMWVALILLIGLPLVLSFVGVIPQWLYWVAFVLFFILFVPTVFWANKHQAALREEKGSDNGKGRLG